jgi:hypothetical protein
LTGSRHVRSEFRRDVTGGYRTADEHKTTQIRQGLTKILSSSALICIHLWFKLS